MKRPDYCILISFRKITWTSVSLSDFMTSRAGSKNPRVALAYTVLLNTAKVRVQRNLEPKKIVSKFKDFVEAEEFVP